MNYKQEYLLGMLKEIHEICEKNGISYYIGRGTLLGAVRNGGFLPWDDDADILMPYDSWLKFKEACKTDLPANRHLGGPDLSESYGHLIPRYVSCDTTCIHSCQSLHDDVAGEVIDIFILDPIADGDEAYQEYIQDLHMYSSVVNYSNVAGRRFEIDAEEFKRYLDLERENGRLSVARELEAKLASHFDENGSRYVYRWHGVQAIYERSWFEHTVPVRFEDAVFNAPSGIAEFLTSYYGEEWFEVPTSVNPEKHVTAQSFKFPYTEALDLFHPEFDRDALREEMGERRYLVFKNAALENRLSDEKAQMIAAFVKSDVEALVSENRELFDEALANRDAEALNTLLHWYITWQIGYAAVGRKWVKSWRRWCYPVYADVSDEIFLGGLYALLGTHRIARASQLIDVRMKHGHPLSPDMALVHDAIGLFRESQAAFMRKDYVEGLSKARQAIGVSPIDVHAFYEFACMCAVEVYGADGREAVELVDACRAKLPDDGVFIKMQGDRLLAAGDEDAAHACYLQAAEYTHNGFVLSDILEKTGYYPSWMRRQPWAKALGVSEWAGQSPELLDDALRIEPLEFEDARKKYLFGLLCELARICDENQVVYVLCPEAVQALFKQGVLPSRMEAYALYCEPGDMDRLRTALEGLGRASRQMEFMGNSSAVADRSLRYHGADSVLLDTGKGFGEFPSLYVSAVPVEPEAYPASFSWIGGSEDGKASPGMRGRLLSMRNRLARKIGMNAPRAQAFSKAMKYASSATGAKAVVMPNGVQRRFDEAFVRESASKDFGGCSFKVPADIDGYLEQYPCRDAGPWLQLGGKLVCAVSGGVSSFEQAGDVDGGFNGRIREFRRASKRSAAINRKFNSNFRQMQLAVWLKEIKLELMPRKQEILDLASRGETATVADIMGDYVECAREFGDAGDVCFDDELYALLKKLL